MGEMWFGGLKSVWERKIYALLLSIRVLLFWLPGLMILTFSSQSKGNVSGAIHFSYWIIGWEAIKLPSESPVLLETAMIEVGGYFPVGVD